MRIPCPICGDRDLREFTPKTDSSAVSRPDPEADMDVWTDWLHNRDNQPGDVAELFYHGQGCGAWIVVTRNVVTHEIKGSQLAQEVTR